MNGTTFYFPLPVEEPYQPNPPSHTRLLLLSPGTGAQPLHGILEYVNIDHAPAYEALSYTWGPHHTPNSMYCHNGYLPIRTNLEAALLNLRLSTQARRLWIDAICINQHDLNERSKQVQYMRHIYKRATRVIIWLGLKTQGIEDAFTLAFQIAEYRRHGAAGTSILPQTVGGSRPERRDTSAATTYLAQQSFGLDVRFGVGLDGVGDQGNASEADGLALLAIKQNPQAAHSLQDLITRPYFGRIWCIQEVLVSSWPVAKCEDLEMDFFDLMACAFYLHYSQNSLFTGQTLEFWNFIYMQRRGHAPASQIEHSLGGLLPLLVCTRDFQATDPRDKIFTLLGISDEGLKPATALTGTLGTSRAAKLFQNLSVKLADWTEGLGPNGDLMTRHPALRADYKKDVVDVYTDLARFTIRKSPRVLEILSYVAHVEEPIASPYPSWVPNWHQSRNVSILWLGGLCSGLVSARVPYYARVHDNPLRGTTQSPSVLALDGFRVDRVQRVSDVMLHEMNEHVKVGGVWSQLFSIPYKFPSGMTYRSGETLEAAFHRVLTADVIGAAVTTMQRNPDITKNDRPGSALAQESKQNVDAVIKELSRQPINANGAPMTELATPANFEQALTSHTYSNAQMNQQFERAVDWETGARSFSHSRRVYITDGGYMGLGPKMMREGDEVVVFYGGRLPFIIRDAGQGFHVFVGDTYLHDDDIMWGKTVDAVNEKRGAFREETFRLR